MPIPLDWELETLPQWGQMEWCPRFETAAPMVDHGSKARTPCTGNT